MNDRNSTNKKHRDKPLSPADVRLDELPVVEVSDQMHRLAELIAKTRQVTYEPINGGRVYGQQKPIDANTTGVIGELAVQKETGNIEQAIYVRGDPGYDLVHNSTTVDVKATATDMRLPDLLVPYDQELVADVYMLVHRFDPRQVRVVGWAPRHVVADREPERHPGTTLNYVVRPEELYLF